VATQGQAAHVDQNVSQDQSTEIFKQAQAAASDKLNKQLQKKSEDVVSSFIDQFQKAYGSEEVLKAKVDNEVNKIKGLTQLKDKNEVILSLLNTSVEKLENSKKKISEINKEKSEIQSITGYTEILKKIELIRKDKKFDEVLSALEKISPKLAFEHGKSLTNNFINLPMNTKVANDMQGHNVIAGNKTAISAISCVKKGDGYF